jgi:hypothetical protein
MVLARRPIPEVAHTDLGEAFLARESEHALPEDALSHGGKKRKDIDLHKSLATMGGAGQPVNE